MKAGLTILCVTLLSAACATVSRPPIALEQFEALDAGSAILENHDLTIALPVRNAGRTPLQNVVIDSVAIERATLAEPKLVPQKLGTLRPDEKAIVFATFAGAFEPEQTYTISAQGTATAGRARRAFTISRAFRIPPRSPASAEAREAATEPHRVSGRRYPPQRPNFSDEVNRPAKWAVPRGTYRPMTHVSEPTKLEKAKLGDPPGVVFTTIQPLNLAGGSTVNEPSGAAGGGIVFVSANWYAAYSDGGGAFTQLDPTTIFPNDLGGYCCDQIVQYVPSVDRFIWYLQYGAGGRIAAASPAGIRASGGTAWTYWDFSAASLGFGGFDFPDLAIGDHSA